MQQQHMQMQMHDMSGVVVARVIKLHGWLMAHAGRGRKTASRYATVLVALARVVRRSLAARSRLSLPASEEHACMHALLLG